MFRLCLSVRAADPLRGAGAAGYAQSLTHSEPVVYLVDPKS
jgi:hypothetical protein